MSADPSTSAVAGLEFSSDKSRLDLAFCEKAVREANYNPEMPAADIRKAVWFSLCIGAYVDNKQVGLIRFVTDSSLFSSLTDLYVDEAFRGKGIGTGLLNEAFRHVDIRHTHCILRARQHLWLFYWRAADFKIMDRRHGIMQRVAR